MRIGGQYVGLGLGDVSEETRLLKAFMRRKFSYAKALEDTPIYDPQLVTAVAEMQGRYNQDGKLASGTYTPGVINLETKYVMGYLQRPPGPDTRPVLFTVCGTGVPWWVGPDADTARAVEDKWRWQPIGYPAQPFPMSPSINAGKAELRAQLNRDEPGFQLRKQVERNGAGLAGYSQGAVVTSETWEFDIKPDNGALNWVKDHMLKAVTWGNPAREQGHAYPDPGAPMAAPNTAGVAYITDRLHDTPPWWHDYATRATCTPPAAPPTPQAKTRRLYGGSCAARSSSSAPTHCWSSSSRLRSSRWPGRWAHSRRCSTRACSSPGAPART